MVILEHTRKDGIRYTLEQYGGRYYQIVAHGTVTNRRYKDYGKPTSWLMHRGLTDKNFEKYWKQSIEN
mgnify:CR=1 FL=1